MVVPAASDRTALNPAILFKATAPTATKDFEAVRTQAGSKIFAQYGKRPTYNEALTLSLFKNQYAQPTIEEWKGVPRILIFDQFQGTFLFRGDSESL